MNYMTDKQKQALRVLERLLDVNDEPVITKNEWLLLFDFIVGDTESITITIPKDLKGTDTDGGVVGEKGEQGEQRDFDIDKYRSLTQQLDYIIGSLKNLRHQMYIWELIDTKKIKQ